MEVCKLSIYTDVKTAVSARDAAEFYGFNVKKNGMMCCPFHDDRHPSMKVDKRFYCFGCEAKGDVMILLPGFLIFRLMRQHRSWLTIFI